MFNRNLEFCYICGKKFATLQKESPISMVEFSCPYCGACRIGEMAATILEHTNNPTFRAGNYEQVKLRSALFYYLRVKKKNHLNQNNYDGVDIYAQQDLVDYKMAEMKNPLSLEEAYNSYPLNEEEKLICVLELLGSFLQTNNQNYLEKYFTSESDPTSPIECLYLPVTNNYVEENQETMRKLRERGYISWQNDQINLTLAGQNLIQNRQKEKVSV